MASLEAQSVLFIFKTPLRRIILVETCDTSLKMHENYNLHSVVGTFK